MKVSVVNADESVFEDIWKGKPFSLTRDKWTFTEDLEEADYILGYTDYLDCNKDYDLIASTEAFRLFSHKFVFVSMHDHPYFCYKDVLSIKLNCQPLYPADINRQHRNIVIPLHMRHFDHVLQQDKEFIEECRNMPKEYDFVFIGQIGYGNRDWMKKLLSDKFLYKQTTPIFHIQNVDERVNIMKEFCRDVAKAKFSFCPRGIGTSSFRLYQSLMVGSVPIIWGQPEMPFTHLINWRRAVADVTDLQDEKFPVYYFKHLSDKQYNRIRSYGMNIWDKYLTCNQTDDLIITFLKNREHSIFS